MLGFLAGFSLVARVLTAAWHQHAKTCGFHVICGPRNGCLAALAGLFCFFLS